VKRCIAAIRKRRSAIVLCDTGTSHANGSFKPREFVIEAVVAKPSARKIRATGYGHNDSRPLSIANSAGARRSARTRSRGRNRAR